MQIAYPSTVTDEEGLQHVYQELEAKTAMPFIPERLVSFDYFSYASMIFSVYRTLIYSTFRSSLLPLFTCKLL